MTTVCFESEKLKYDHDNEYLHYYELGEISVIPNVGDIVYFDDDTYYTADKRKANGTRFIVTKKTISLSRKDGCKDDCFVLLNVDPYREDQGCDNAKSINHC